MGLGCLGGFVFLVGFGFFLAGGEGGKSWWWVVFLFVCGVQFGLFWFGCLGFFGGWYFFLWGCF